MKSRVVVLVICLSAAFLALLVRLFDVQVLPNRALERLRKTQYMTMIPLPSQRGKILDRRGEELATSVTAQSLYADPSLIRAPRKISRKLSSILGMKSSEIYSLLRQPRRFVWIKRRLDPDVAAQIREWREPGLKFVEEPRRAYPNQSLLSQTLGFVGSDGEGLEGLEKKYDGELRGEKQSVLAKRDARGRPLIVSGQLFEIHADGATIQTTIDKDLQYELERELAKVNAKENADRSTGIIMDPATGEVLAMASYPTYDLNQALRSNPEARRDRAVTDIYEPGSTFKVVTIASALRTGRIFPNTKYFCENGKFRIGKRVIHEAETGHGFGWLSVAEILQVSSNIGSTKIAFDVGQDNFKKMIRAFGFGSKTGIDFPGEASGMIDAGVWPEHLLSNVSFGHGIGVTAIQMASAYNAIANGGKLMRPFFVKRIIDSDQKVIEEREPVVVRQVLTPKEASMLTLMLSGVTQEGGTGTLARVDGYPVAGKTGTAQKVDPHGHGYMHHAYISSFLGFVPANNPQFTIYVIVDNPKKQFYGAQVAAPVFNHLASFALHQRGFLPIVVGDTPLASLDKKKNEKTAAGKNKKPAASVAGSAIPENMVHADLNDNEDVVPDFKGLTIRDVSRLLKARGKKIAGLQIQLLGSGVASSQWPPPGKPWPDKTSSGPKIKVVFKPE